MDTHELAWAAGFVDGEGCFSVMKIRRGRPRNYPLLTISQREPPDVLYRFQAAVGVGYVNGPYQTIGRPAYYYRVNGAEKVFRVVKLLWPWLSPVKRRQARKVILLYRETRIT
jgi:hypothetical protein